MGYSCTSISDPHVKTKKPVNGLDDVTVWLIAGEGKTPKSYYLASKFIAAHCQTNIFPGTELPNQISGSGKLTGKSIPISKTTLLSLIRTDSANFVRGFYETHNTIIISALQVLL